MAATASERASRTPAESAPRKSGDRRLFLLRQKYSKDRAAALPVANNRAAAMGGCDELDQVQAEPDPSARFPLSDLHRSELLEELVLERVGDTHAPIGDLDL